MVERTLTIQSPRGLHLRPASHVSETALKYRSKCTMIIGDKSYNMKSVLSVLSAQVSAKKEVLLQCEGSDEEDAIQAIVEALQDDPDETDSEPEK